MLRQEQRGPAHRLSAPAADHAGLGEQGVDSDRRCRGGGCVRSPGSAPAGRTATDHRQQGLAFGEASSHSGELRRVAERLQVQRRCGHLGIVDPCGQQVVARHVRLVAQRDEGLYAQAQVAGEVEQGDPHSAGLGGDRETAGRGHGAGEGGIQPHLRVVGHDAQAVRTNQADVVLTGDAEQLTLHRGALRPRALPARRR